MNTQTPMGNSTPLRDTVVPPLHRSPTVPDAVARYKAQFGTLYTPFFLAGGLEERRRFQQQFSSCGDLCSVYVKDQEHFRNVAMGFLSYPKLGVPVHSVCTVSDLATYFFDDPHRYTELTEVQVLILKFSGQVLRKEFDLKVTSEVVFKRTGQRLKTLLAFFGGNDADQSFVRTFNPVDISSIPLEEEARSRRDEDHDN